jgi:hypothetical protein
MPARQPRCLMGCLHGFPSLGEISRSYVNYWMFEDRFLSVAATPHFPSVGGLRVYTLVGVLHKPELGTGQLVHVGMTLLLLLLFIY